MSKRRKGIRRRKKRSAGFNPKAADCHHLLWQARHWDYGSAKALRNHDYFKMLIPRDTVHREIHSRIADIPMPGQELCKMALRAVNQGLKDGILNMVDDSAEQRLDFLIWLWEDKGRERTVTMLRWQKEVFAEFNERGN